MAHFLRNTMKAALVVVLTFAVFLIMRSILADVGGMPDAFKNAYPPSVFVETGTFTPAIILLMSTILLHLLFNYRALNLSMPCPDRIKGATYGFLFGMLWFLGFLELVFVYGSSLERHVSSGIRDLVTLTWFGVLSGLFFSTPGQPHIGLPKSAHAAIIVVCVSVSFAFFHWLQYALTLPQIEQRVDDALSVFWLLITGAWIGVMSIFLGNRTQTPLGNAFNFSVNVFGVNWLLYTSFYALFLAIPIADILIRCMFGIVGVFVGLRVSAFCVSKMESGLRRPHA